MRNISENYFSTIILRAPNSLMINGILVFGTNDRDKLIIVLVNSKFNS